MNTKIVVLCNKDYTDRPELPDVVYVEYGNEKFTAIPTIRELDSKFNLVVVAADGGENKTEFSKGSPKAYAVLRFRCRTNGKVFCPHMSPKSKYDTMVKL